MKMIKGDLVLSRGLHNHNRNEFAISVVLDDDIGCSNCHIRDIYRLDKTLLYTTMNWQNIRRDKIIGVITNIGDKDYTADFIDIKDKVPMIQEKLQEMIPEYML